ncbi:aspartyl-phosphate phosphatase Spo0E family protein [Sporosarcina pasteurii]|uniref:Spo0E like sporulation regulatory protein n=1 Tax=Sporosarcina pasteurii TaxID=1474 RepID=A0A380BEJ0_SPOPA|nr:aspartyl-phosphate phosphatase Spo0E family protein [Sporosarcina pasteurii]MDS9470417.1 aspartyl-phosphate phosphatase Spo0E family protein [Sporosarcina pasteurii]QBQ05884.1 aspartyl-phosphate phosphatase Spo0E family protein [Sporosarcina pasteurii]SUJ00219.1 Spo0E like sporulation regulatory protein [Sporosarcina pasteurii]
MRQNLMDEIEQLRVAMIITANQKGFSSRETIDLSRKLDILLNELESDKDSLR